MPFALTILTAVIFYTSLYSVGAGVIWRILPKDRRETLRKRRMCFHLTLLGYLALFILGCCTLNRYYMPGMVMPIQVSFKVLLLVYTMFIGWTCLRKGRSKTMVFGTVGYVLFIVLSGIGSSISFSSNNPVSQSGSDALATLGYVSWVNADKDGSKVSVTKYDKNNSYDGLNLYTYTPDSKAFLIDMEGNVVHTWTLSNDSKLKWLHAEMLPNGDLLSCASDRKLSMIDRNSRKIWDISMPSHHDMFVMENGDVYALAHGDEIGFFAGLPVPIIADYIAIISADGIIKDRIDFAEPAKKHLKPRALFAAYKKIVEPEILRTILNRKLHGMQPMPPIIELNTFHSNSIQVIDRDIEGLCRRGDILLSMREIDLIAILDSETGTFVWEWGPGIIEKQHHPTLLENGNILIFDNGSRRGYSTVIELNPLTNSIVWKYQAERKEDFFSAGRGGCQRLPNGNTLITESGKGRVFEVTPNGSIVWEFFTPKQQGDESKRVALYRMMRVTKPLWLNQKQ